MMAWMLRREEGRSSVRLPKSYYIMLYFFSPHTPSHNYIKSINKMKFFFVLLRNVDTRSARMIIACSIYAHAF